MRTTDRRLTLADLAILIAGAAGGLFLLRMVLNPPSSRSTFAVFRGGVGNSLVLAPFLISGALALLLASTIGDRPYARATLRHPGTFGCVTFLAAFASNIMLEFARNQMSFLFYGQGRWPLFPDARYFVFHSFGCGQVVAAVWACLFVTHRWCPEPSWIDRSGRLLGAISILVWIVARLIP